MAGGAACCCTALRPPGASASARRADGEGAACSPALRMLTSSFSRDGGCARFNVVAAFSVSARGLPAGVASSVAELSGETRADSFAPVPSPRVSLGSLSLALALNLLMMRAKTFLGGWGAVSTPAAGLSAFRRFRAVGTGAAGSCMQETT